MTQLTLHFILNLLIGCPFMSYKELRCFHNLPWSLAGYGLETVFKIFDSISLEFPTLFRFYILSYYSLQNLTTLSLDSYSLFNEKYQFIVSLQIVNNISIESAINNTVLTCHTLNT